MNAPELRLPPHSVEAEQSLIGGLLIPGADGWDRIADVVTAADFYRDDHRRIFMHIARLANAGKPVDVVTVFESIEQSNEVDQVGGMSYLGEIANNTPSVANIRRYAQVVHDRARLRRLIEIGDGLSSACFAAANRNPEEIIAETEIKLAEASDDNIDEPASLKDGMVEALQYIDSRGETGGLKTGFPAFDSLTGGLEPGQLILVAARPSVGKSAFACNVADKLVDAGKAVMFFSLEMTRREISMRILASRSQVSVHAMRAGTKNRDEWDRMYGMVQPAEKQRLFIDDRPAISVGYVRARARRIQRKAGLDLVIVDYLGLMKGQGDNRVQEIGSISRGLKALAKELGVPVLLMAQLNRGVESRNDKRPVLSDLRDSGEIEQDADLVAMLHREELHNERSEWKGFAELIIRKHRNGPLGDVSLAYDGRLMNFSPWNGDSPRRYLGLAARPKGGFKE